jgi:GAF domain-containing protein
MSARPESPEQTDLREDHGRRLAELSSLYEAARKLLGARDHQQVASRIVHSGMGVLGSRSGAMFVADDRGRYRLLHSAGIEAAERGEHLPIPGQAREWLLREGAFVLTSTEAARGMAELRDRLAEHYDATLGASVSDAHGLLGLLVFGPRLLPTGYDDGHVALLDSLTALAAQALSARPARDGASTDGIHTHDGGTRRAPAARGPARDLVSGPRAIRRDRKVIFRSRPKTPPTGPGRGL